MRVREFKTFSLSDSTHDLTALETAASRGYTDWIDWLL